MKINKDTYTDSYGKTHRISRMQSSHMLNVIVLYDKHIQAIKRLAKERNKKYFEDLLLEKQHERDIMVTALEDLK